MVAELQPKKAPAVSTRELIVNALKSKHPTTVSQLARIVSAENGPDEEEFTATVKAMVVDGALLLGKPSCQIESVLDYLFTLTLSAWLWLTLGVTALALLVVSVTPDIFPINTIRWVLGSVLVLYLPGYGLVKLLFYKSEELDGLERFALSVGLSLAVVPLMGLILNFTPWGIRFVPITASLGLFTITFSVGAAAREYSDFHSERRT